MYTSNIDGYLRRFPTLSRQLTEIHGCLLEWMCSSSMGFVREEGSHEPPRPRGGVFASHASLGSGAPHPTSSGTTSDHISPSPHRTPFIITSDQTPPSPHLPASTAAASSSLTMSPATASCSAPSLHHSSSFLSPPPSALSPPIHTSSLPTRHPQAAHTSPSLQPSSALPPSSNPWRNECESQLFSPSLEQAMALKGECLHRMCDDQASPAPMEAAAGGCDAVWSCGVCGLPLRPSVLMFGDTDPVLLSRLEAAADRYQVSSRWP